MGMLGEGGECSFQRCRSIKFLLTTLLAAATGGYQEFEMLRRRKMRRGRRMSRMWTRFLHKEPKQWFTSQPGVMLFFFPGSRRRRWRTRRKSAGCRGRGPNEDIQTRQS